MPFVVDDIAALQRLVSEDAPTCNSLGILRDGDVVLRMQAAIQQMLLQPSERSFQHPLFRYESSVKFRQPCKYETSSHLALAGIQRTDIVLA